MYTRTYDRNPGEIIIPERYGGTSFSQSSTDDKSACDAEECVAKNPWENEEDIHTSVAQTDEEAVETSSFKEKLSSIGIVSKIFNNDLFSLQKIGKEEILIISTAIFLLLSKEGDKECAVMLLLLLFMS